MDKYAYFFFWARSLTLALWSSCLGQEAASVRKYWNIYDTPWQAYKNLHVGRMSVVHNICPEVERDEKGGEFMNQAWQHSHKMGQFCYLNVRHGDWLHHLCVQFAQAASGNATVMLNGSVSTPFNSSRSVPPLPAEVMDGDGVFWDAFCYFQCLREHRGSELVPRQGQEVDRRPGHTKHTCVRF